jgi:hypothetical protein
MPFTIAHAAAVLPLGRLSRYRLPMSALMVGAMSPDFAYFLPVEVSRFTTHDLPGIFQFCWPAGLAVWLVYVLLLERPTIALLPDAWRLRVAPGGPLSWTVLVFASLAIMLGAATHIVWDLFTHSSPVVDAIPPLREVRVQVGPFNPRLYKLLQYVSSVFGLAVLAIWAWRLRRGPLLPPARVVPAVSSMKRLGAVAVLLAASCGLALVSYLSYPDPGFQGTIFLVCIGGMTGWAIAWCAVSAWIRVSERGVLSRRP